MKSRQEAMELLDEFVRNNSLKKHCLGVAVSMERYARKNGLPEGEIEKWWITGLLHDFDWEIHSTLEKHPSEGVKILGERGVEEDICEAILGHGEHTGVKRKSLMAKTLFAVDELSGFIIAIAKIRPGGFDGMSVKSVRKKIRNKDFAAAISRDDIRKGIEELGTDEGAHFQLVIDALRERKEELGFG
jgi:predicted hydrolase (HD superfamily)